MVNLFPWRGWTALTALVLLAGFAGIPAAPAHVQAAAADYDITGGHFFTEASTVPDAGFAITDADGVPFWHGYLAMGGPKVLGYPISSRFLIGGTLCQVMQRAVLQWVPAGHGGTVRLLNTLDLLHRAGLDGTLLQYYGIPAQADWRGDAAAHGAQNAIYARHLALVEAVRQSHPALFYAYSLGGIPLYGLPMAPVTATDAGWILRTQRAVLLELRAGTTLGQVRLMDVGSYARDLGLFGRAAFVPQGPPAELAALLQPSARRVDLLAGNRLELVGVLAQGTLPLQSVPATLAAQVHAQVIDPSGVPLPDNTVQVQTRGVRFHLVFTPPVAGAYTLRVWLTGTFHGLALPPQPDTHALSITLTPDSWSRRFTGAAPWSYLACALPLACLLALLGRWLAGNPRRARARIARWGGTARFNQGTTPLHIGAAHFRHASPWSLLVGRPHLRLARVHAGARGSLRLTAHGPRYRAGRWGRWQAISPLHPIDVGTTGAPPARSGHRGAAGPTPRPGSDMPARTPSTPSSLDLFG